MKIPDIIFVDLLQCYVEVEYDMDLMAVRFVRNSEKRKERKTHKATFELDEYFKGKRTDFSCGLDISGCSAFSQKVLEETGKIKYGSTITYSELADRIGTRAVRAVGSALAGNHVPIIIPCHRVVAKKGIGGYSGGIDMKLRLLEFEQKALMGNNL